MSPCRETPQASGSLAGCPEGGEQITGNSCMLCHRLGERTPQLQKHDLNQGLLPDTQELSPHSDGRAECFYLQGTRPA